MFIAENYQGWSGRLQPFIDNKHTPTVGDPYDRKYKVISKKPFDEM
jgi:hypothetical protein